jgi:hypothetical protein
MPALIGIVRHLAKQYPLLGGRTSDTHNGRNRLLYICPDLEALGVADE